MRLLSYLLAGGVVVTYLPFVALAQAAAQPESVATPCTVGDAPANSLSEAESKEGWRLMFDGAILDHWTTSGDVAVLDKKIRIGKAQTAQIETREKFSAVEISFCYGDYVLPSDTDTSRAWVYAYDRKVVPFFKDQELVARGIGGLKYQPWAVGRVTVRTVKGESAASGEFEKPLARPEEQGIAFFEGSRKFSGKPFADGTSAGSVIRIAVDPGVAVSLWNVKLRPVK